MKNLLTKADVPFLVTAMDSAPHPQRFLQGGPGALGAPQTISGEMSIPKPLSVDVNGTMSISDFKACSLLMGVCQNMVQKTLVRAAATKGISAADALKNMGAWVKGYVDFPLPFFNFKDTISDEYSKSEFSLQADAKDVETLVNIKGVQDLKDAVVGALQKNGGTLASHKDEKRKFNYFGVITAYHEHEIAIRLVKFQMDLETTKVEALCAKTEKTALKSAYETYQFVGDKQMMIKMQSKMGDQMVDHFAEVLLEFVKDYYAGQMKDYEKALADLLQTSK